MKSVMLIANETTVARKLRLLRFSDFDASAPSNLNSFFTIQLERMCLALILTSPAPRIASMAGIFAALRAGSHAESHTVKNETTAANINACHAITKVAISGSVLWFASGSKNSSRFEYQKN